MNSFTKKKRKKIKKLYEFACRSGICPINLQQFLKKFEKHVLKKVNFLKICIYESYINIEINPFSMYRKTFLFLENN